MAREEHDGAEAHDCRLSLGNEYASVSLEITNEANGPRVRITSHRDHREVVLDPVALDLICHARQELWDLLADAARDSAAWDEFQPAYRDLFS